MRNALIIGILGIATIGSIAWGYNEHQEKEKIAIEAENQYQRAYNELAYNIDTLHDKIGTTLAMNSRTSLSPALIEVWRIATEAQTDVGQLPLGLLPFSETQEFLTDVGNFSYHTSVRDLEKNPLTDKEYAALKSMYAEADEVEDQLRSVQNSILDRDLKWLDVEQLLKDNKTPEGNAIIDGFTKVENTTKSYVKNDFGVTASRQTESDDFQYLTGEKISKEKAKKIAHDFVGHFTAKEITDSLAGAHDPYYHITLVDEKSKSSVYMNVTKQGGKPIYFMSDRNVEKQNISVDDATIKAEKFLKAKKYENMALYDVAQYDSTVLLTYVTSINNIRIYPESIQIKVALDDGEVVGFNARNYLLTYHKREIPSPKLSLEDAKAKINKNVEIMENRLSIITDDFNEDVLCYEFIGKLEKDTYEIFINAESGAEEKVRKLQNIEQKYD